MACFIRALVFLCLALLISPIAADAAPSPFLDTAQRAILRQLATQWGPFNGSATWLAGSVNTPRRCNTFAGVRKCSEEGFIVTLALPSAGCTGPLRSLTRLTTIKKLDLSQNNFNGSIAGLAQLSKLTYLNLANNDGLQTIAPQISTLTNLRYFDFGYNDAPGPVPAFLSNLRKLTYLDLLFNYFEGRLPSGYGRLTDLRFLRISKSREGIFGIVPKSYSALKKLRHLQLNDNTLSGGIPSFIGNFVDLTYLRLSNNNWGGNIPDSFSRLTNLVFLGLRYATLGGSIPNGLGHLRQLTYLSLNENGLQGTVPKPIFLLTKLRTLTLENNYLSGTLPTNLGHLQKLSQLTLSNNLFTGRIPRIVPRRIGSLDVSGNYFYGEPIVFRSNGKRVCDECVDGACTFAFSTGGNCLTYPKNFSSCASVEEQRPKAQCAAFCGTGTPRQQCNGKGVCVPKGIKWGVGPTGFKCTPPSP